MKCELCNTFHISNSECKSSFNGFQNRAGESNCFLNSALQILVNLKEFSARVLMKEHLNGTFTDMVSKIFTNYKEQRNSVIDITEARQKLALVYSQQGLFDLNSPADSIEALLESLTLIHFDFCKEINNETCSGRCPSHQVFGIQVEEELKCHCGKQKLQNWDRNSFAHHVYVSELFVDIRITFEEVQTWRIDDLHEYFEKFTVVDCEGKLPELLKNECFAQIEICAGGDESCEFKTSTKFTRLLKQPRVYIVHLIWDYSRPSLINLLQLLASIPMSLDLNSVFKTGEPQNYELLSLVAFGVGHYISLINKGGVWFCTDDCSVRRTGTWKDVTIYLMKSRFYPVGLFYSFCEEMVKSQVSLEEWMQLEFYTMQLAKENSPKKSEPWKCECGQHNFGNFDYCELCNRVRTGVDGWVCSFCTYMNELQESLCLMCQNEKEKVPVRKVNYNTNMKFSIQKPTLHTVKNIDHQCKSCKVKLNKKIGICPQCLIKTTNPKCIACKNPVVADYCEDCLFITEFCPKCQNQTFSKSDCLCTSVWTRKLT